MPAAVLGRAWEAWQENRQRLQSRGERMVAGISQGVVPLGGWRLVLCTDSMIRLTGSTAGLSVGCERNNKKSKMFQSIGLGDEMNRTALS